jgi:tetratricopeptide (TPR) repeat protein
MRNSTISLSMIGLITLGSLAGCNMAKKEKNTEIPATTQSKEALASFRQGVTLMDQGDGQKARTFFMKAIEQDPKMAIAYIFKSGTDFTNKEFADDMANAKSNLEGVTDWEKWYYDYTATFLSSDWNKRLQISQQIATAFPDAARPQVDLGITYSNGKDETKARECFRKAVTLEPKWVGGYNALVMSYLFMDPKDPKQAEENAMKVVELAPSSPGAEIALGDCYRAQNDLAKARDSYSKAIELDPNVSEAYYKKGHANTFLGNFDEARQNYMDGGKHDESSTSSTQFIAYTYLYAGDFKTAMNWLYDQASKLNPSGDASGKTNSAKMMCLQDCAGIAMFTNDAAKLKEIIGMLEPLSLQMGDDLGTSEGKITQKAQILGHQAILATLEGNYDMAKSKAEEMKTLLEPITDPGKLDNYEFTLGFINLKQKNASEAINHLEKSRMTNVLNKYFLAMACEASGNKEKANALYKELSDYNFNGLDYALVRSDVKKKVASL